MMPDGSLHLNTDMEHIHAILAANKLTVRDERMRMRGMITAVQPLIIDGKEICDDTLLAECITYTTSDQMIRETDTLTIKKAAFGDFESSMTPIPKYCFRNMATRETVLVHSVTRVTLDDILSVSEQEYPRPYTYDKMAFYSDWVKAIIGRMQSIAKPVKARLIKTVIRLPHCLLPQPPHIGQLERKTFAALIFRAVGHHHRKGIYHDCISDRTIFFPTPYQPLLLSNYSGVPGAMLYDCIPMELMTDEAVTDYGPQCRDIYCLALIGYRIMRGEKIDGRRFKLDSPRPLGMVVGEIALAAHLTGCGTNVVEIKHTVISLFKTVKGIASMVPLLFSRDTFSAWRKINRATGGLWRTLPIIGPFCDLFAPTECAQTLRYILDKSWFMTYFFRRVSPSDQSNSRGPDITLLARAFKVRHPAKCPRFEAALNALLSETILKRKAFGSIMESGFSIKRAYRFIVNGRNMAIGSAALLLVTLVSLMWYYQKHAAPVTYMTKPSAAATTSAASALPETMQHSVAIKSYRAAEPSAIPVTPPDTARKIVVLTPSATSTPSVKESNDVQPVAVKKPAFQAKKGALRNNGNRQIRPSNATVTKKKSVATGMTTTPAQKISMKPNIGSETSATISSTKATVAAAAPKGYLYPVKDRRNVFVVTGLKDSCNPGHLHYAIEGRESAIMISQLPMPAFKLFMARRSYTGYGFITTIRLCRTRGCDQTMYYEAVGTNEIGKPVYITSGDVICLDRIKLRLFIKEKRSSSIK
jgi:hypothetical protein